MKYGGFFPGTGIEAMIYIPVALILIVLLSMTATKVSSEEIAVRSEGVHFVVLITIELTAMITFIFYRKTINEIYEKMGRGFYDYENTLDEECYEVSTNAYKQGTLWKKMFHNVFASCSMSTILTLTIVRPIITYFNGDPNPDDGILRMIPVPLWLPINEKPWFITFILLLMEFVIIYVTPGIVFGCILFVVSASIDGGTQLIILGHALKTVVRRAERLNMPREDAIKVCFVHSIKHHQILLDYIKSLGMILNIPGFVLLFGSSILMCMSGFIFVSKEVTFISKIIFLLFLVSELTIIFLICWCGEFIQTTSTLVCDMVYSSEWPDNWKSMKSTILIIQVRTLKPIILNLGGFMVASLETFGNICSSAFSYFNLLLAVN